MNGSRSTIVACSSGVVLSRGCFAHRAWILRLQPLLDAVGMEVMPAFQYPQHILVFVTLLSECIHRSEIEFNSFGPWLYNIKHQYTGIYWENVPGKWRSFHHLGHLDQFASGQNCNRPLLSHTLKFFHQPSLCWHYP